MNLGRSAEGETKDKTEWHRVVVFGKMAETAAEYMKKGQLVYIEGRLQTRSWEDKDKVKRYTTEVLCDNFTMLGPKRRWWRAWTAKHRHLK